MAHEGTVPDDAAPEDSAHHAPGRITRVILKNYKSIVSCDVELQPLTILVGPNGSGKSNFLDALAFVSEALTVGLEQAIRNRGNIERILSAARPSGDDSFSIELHFQLENGETGHYGFTVNQDPEGIATRSDETLSLSRDAPTGAPKLHINGQDVPVFFLIRESRSKGRNLAYDLLTSMVFYNPLPDQMRDLKRRDPLPHLRSDGENLASMLARMQVEDPQTMESITQYMRRVLPGLESITTEDLAGRDLLRISVASDDPEAANVFDADQLSDGTLRALAVLVALRQGRLGGKSSTSLVGIEEPENNVHPAAARILLAAMESATHDTQILATTHSTAMLDTDDVDVNSLLAVAADNGVTVIAPIDAVGQSVLKDRLFTAGELLQLNQLTPELDSADDQPQVATPSPAVAG